VPETLGLDFILESILRRDLSSCRSLLFWDRFLFILSFTIGAGVSWVEHWLCYRSIYCSFVVETRRIDLLLCKYVQSNSIPAYGLKM
jgi:hypothetical protein